MKVVKQSQLPTKLPIDTTVIMWLLLDKCKSPAWVWGGCGALLILLWIGCCVAIYKQDQTEVSFKEEEK